MAGIPQVITEDRASGAQFIEGSLKFDSSKSQYLKRTFPSVGNQKTYTFSVWLKRGSDFANWQAILTTLSSDNVSNTGAWISSPAEWYYFFGGSNFYSNARARDTGWYHVVYRLDTTIASPDSDRLRVYVNGNLMPWNTSTSQAYPTLNATDLFNSAASHSIGRRDSSNTHHFDGSMSQFYFIDGQSLGPENFGYTDPLTNTWRPKKYNVSKADTVLVGTPTYATSDFKTEGNKTSDQTGLSFGSWTSGSYTGAETKIFKNSTDTAFTLNIGLVGGTTDRILWYSDNLTDWTFVGNTNPSRNYQLSGHKYYATSEGSGSTTLHATADGHNTFYLPMDGNTLIGKDQSGNGNDWTPANFGGSVELPKATGALPILNTDGGGNVAVPGVFGSNVSKVIAVTVSNASGSNKYYFDSILNPTLPLIRGSIISFDTSDSSNDSHPFKLSSTNADSSGGTEYTDGVAYFVNGSQKNASDYVSQYSSHSSGFRGIKWTVPHDVSTTYYYCTSHTGMGNNGRLNSTTDVTKADPFAWKCFLALPLNGTPFDMSSTLNRTSSGKAITNSGTNQSSVTSNFYGRSALFDGSNDQLSVEAHGQMSFGADDDWTFELWFNTTTVGNGWAISDYSGNASATGSPGGQIYFSSSTGLHWYQNSAKYAEIPKEEIKANKWHHVAFVKDGTANTITSFLDGVIKTTSSFNDTSGSSTGGLIIGQQGGGTWFSGYMSDFRVYKGIKKYTSDFIPASTNPDILPDTPSGITGKTNLTKITEGAVALSRSPESHLVLPDSNDLAPEGGDFTIETFMYARSLDNYPVIWDTRESNAGDTNGFFFGIDNTGLLYMYDQSAVRINGGAGAIDVGRWYHVALVRKNNDIKMYRDGVQLGVTYSRPHNFTNKLKFIGDSPNTEVQVWQFNGFYSNWRFTKGQALYDGNFDVPTEPLTATSQGATGSNVKLLACQSPTSVTATTVQPSYDITVTSSNDGIGSVGNLSAITSTGSNYYLDYRTVGRAWVQLDFASTQSSVTSIKLSGGGYLAGSNYDLYVNGVLVEDNRSTVTGWAEDTITISSTNIDSIRIDGSDGYAIGAVKFNDTLVSGTIGGITVNGSPSATNFNPFTDDINTIRGQASGYATLNPLIPGAATLTEGNLTATSPSGHSAGRSTLTMDTSGTGKFYFEATLALIGGTYAHIGVLDAVKTSDAAYVGSTANCFSYRHNGDLHPEGTAASAYGESFTTGDTIGCSLDCGSGELRFYKNGVDQGVATTITADYHACFAVSNYGSSGQWNVNFGQKPFKFPPPDGFQPLNLSTVQPEKVIARPDQYVSAITYSGNNSSSNTVSDLKFNSKPDFVWIKSRSGSSSPGSQNHYLMDSVRGANGASGTSKLYSNNSGAANSGQTATTNGVRFAHNGFELTTNNDGTNSNNNYVAWCWKAGGSKGTFNVDDVGYANASDVNMNVGGLNSASYDQSQVWSNFWSATGNGIESSNPATKSFDGVLTGLGMRLNGSSSCTWAPTGGYSYSGDFLIYACKDNDYTNVSWTVIHAGGTTDITDSVAAGTTMAELNLTNLGIQSPITSLSFTSNNNSNPRIAGMRAGGKLLVDQGVTVANVPSMTATGCSVGTKQGFSIVRYTGSGSAGTVAHGLGQKPTFWIIKAIDAASNGGWFCYTEQLDGSLDWMYLNGNDHKSDSSAVAPTSTTIGITSTLGEAVSWIAYVWHDVPGLQKFGSFTGNSSQNFVELGFRPAVVWVKRAIANSSSDTSTNNSAWTIMDSTRLSYNGQTPNHLYANHTADEGKRGDGSGTSSLGDMTLEPHSNGFYLNGPATETNSNTGKFIYCAWAEAPSINLYGAQANAR